MLSYDYKSLVHLIEYLNHFDCLLNLYYYYYHFQYFGLNYYLDLYFH